VPQYWQALAENLHHRSTTHRCGTDTGLAEPLAESPCSASQLSAVWSGSATFSAVGRSSANFLFHFREIRSYRERKPTLMLCPEHLRRASASTSTIFTNQIVLLISESSVLSGTACNDDLQWRHNAGTSNVVNTVALSQSMATFKDVSQTVILLNLLQKQSVYTPRS
jgi:hypothetical protein